MSSRKRLLEPRKLPVQKRSRATVEEVLTAAAQVFETHGYSAGTTNRIAARAGVSVGTLYQYYPSKEALAVALLERHIVETGRRLKEWVGHMVAEQHGLEDALRDYVEGLLEIHCERPRLQHILLEETPLPPRVHEVLLEAERQAAKTVTGLLRLYPEVRHGNLDRGAYMLVQTAESLTHRFAAHHDENGIGQADFVTELVAMLHAYLAYSPRAGRAGPGGAAGELAAAQTRSRT